MLYLQLCHNLLHLSNYFSWCSIFSIKVLITYMHHNFPEFRAHQTPNGAIKQQMKLHKSVLFETSVQMYVCKKLYVCNKSICDILTSTWIYFIWDIWVQFCSFRQSATFVQLSESHSEFGRPSIWQQVSD